jgi:hypothetical protein
MKQKILEAELCDAALQRRRQSRPVEFIPQEWYRTPEKIIKPTIFKTRKDCIDAHEQIYRSPKPSGISQCPSCLVFG